MTSSHYHAKTGAGGAKVAGDVDRTLSGVMDRVAALEARPPQFATQEAAVLRSLIAAAGGGAPVPVPAGTAVTPADDVRALVDAATGPITVRMHAGTYHFGFGSADRTDAVTLLAFGDGPVVIDGTGLDPHFLYLGPGADWTLGAIKLQGFLPVNSGIVAVGDSCSLTTLDGFEIAGPGVKGDNTSHGVYFHGTGTGTLTNPYVHGVPGAALQTYRGTPQVTVKGGRLGGMYETALIYSGTVVFEATAFTEPSAAWDCRANVTRPVLTGCTGTGPGGAVRLYQD